MARFSLSNIIVNWEVFGLGVILLHHLGLLEIIIVIFHNFLIMFGFYDWHNDSYTIINIVSAQIDWSINNNCQLLSQFCWVWSSSLHHIRHSSMNDFVPCLNQLNDVWANYSTVWLYGASSIQLFHYIKLSHNLDSWWCVKLGQEKINKKCHWPSHSPKGTQCSNRMDQSVKVTLRRRVLITLVLFSEFLLFNECQDI